MEDRRLLSPKLNYLTFRWYALRTRPRRAKSVKKCPKDPHKLLSVFYDHDLIMV